MLRAGTLVSAVLAVTLAGCGEQPRRGALVAGDVLVSFGHHGPLFDAYVVHADGGYEGRCGYNEPGVVRGRMTGAQLHVLRAAVRAAGRAPVRVDLNTGDDPAHDPPSVRRSAAGELTDAQVEAVERAVEPVAEACRRAQPRP
jgi:hypothetical protein